MRGWIVSLVLAAGCGRWSFDPISGDAGGGGVLDGDSDGGLSPLLVQAAALGSSTGSYALDATNGGLQPVTAGHMVLVACGNPSSGTCSISATPATTWQQIDMGTALHVWLTCDAPAITSIQVTPGSGASQVVVTEWSMMRTTGCSDVSRISVGCAAAPSSWSSSFQVNTQQSRELIVAVGMAGGNDAGWAVDPPFSVAKNATGTTGTNVFVAYQLADPAPARPVATGTIAQWTTSCFRDIFAFLTL